MITFQGIVELRSSATPTPDGSPGEAEVLSLNPQRRDRILQATGWKTLFPGSLDLRVTEDCVHRLLLCIPIIRERGEEVVYPDAYSHIPKLRVGYLYFTGRITKGDAASRVLFRRACNPIKNRLKAFAETRLWDTLGLFEGDSVVLEVDE
jgi:hypothetical protein